MVNDITEWVLAANADWRAAFGPNMNKSAIRTFPMDLIGWRYAESPLIKSLKKLPPEWKAIKVIVRVAKAQDRGTGTWDPKTHNLTIILRFKYKHDVDRLSDDVRHELQHVTQSFMADLAKLSDSVAPRPGMPSQHIMTPQHSQALQLYDSRRTYEENYLLDDVEFYPQLNDIINQARKHLKGVEEDQDQRDYLMKLIAGTASIQMAVWKKLAPGKWKKAVKEFYRAFPVLASNSSASRVAGRWIGRIAYQ